VSIETDEALAAEVMAFFGKAEAVVADEGKEGLTVEAWGQREAAVAVAEEELRKAFAGTAARAGQAVFGPALLADLVKVAEGLGLGELAAALTSLAPANLYVVRDRGRVWLPGVLPVHRGADREADELARELSSYFSKDGDPVRAHLINELELND
jgi:hypothetical protein